MVAGASGIDTVVLCVSAVDSVMPQTIEHHKSYNLGVQSGVVAITHADQADEEMIEFVNEDIATTTKGTFLEGAPIFIFQNLHSYMWRGRTKKHLTTYKVFFYISLRH